MSEKVLETSQPTHPIAETKTTNYPKIILSAILGLSLLVGAAYAGYWYGTQQVQQPEEPIPPISQPTTKPISTPTQPTTDPTASWKTYTNGDLYFKYPPHWTLSPYGGPVIHGTNPKVRIVAVTKESTLMNECMKEDGFIETEDFVVIFFSRVAIAPACLTNDLSPREIWVIPNKDTYSPGISYSYSANDNPEAEIIFNQILSTFKFLD